MLKGENTTNGVRAALAKGLVAKAEAFRGGEFAGLGRSGGWCAALAGALVASVCSQAAAGPEGTAVVRGNVSISRNGSETLIRASNNSIINYRSFDIARGETVRFMQPGADSRVLNRINSAAPTRIDGSLIANGRVYMINPAGVIFGQSSVINVSGLYAAAGKLADKDFIRGIDKFTNLAGQVENYGTLTADFIALAGRGVANSGQLVSPQGTVVMAAGDSVMIGERTGNVFVKIGGSAAGASGKAGVENTGEIKAAGGRVRMGSGDVYSIAVRNAGRVKAKDIRVEGQGKGDVIVSGSLDASSETGKGGEVRVLGENVGLTGATIDASGATGGGTVLVGGNYQGHGPERNAAHAFVSGDSKIDVSATQRGDGGRAIVWSDHTTRYYGETAARGGAQRGNGGFVEISGKQDLGFWGKVDTSAPNGKIGQLLLDPATIVIDSGDGTDNAQVADGVINFADGSGTFHITPAAINAVGASVTLQATSAINLTSTLAMTTSGAGLTLSSQGTITIDADLTTTNGAISLTTTGGLIDLQNGCNTFSAGTASITINSSAGITFDTNTDMTGGAISLTAGGDVTFGTSTDVTGTTISVIAAGNIVEQANTLVGTTSITLHSGTDGTGNITFPAGTSLNSPSISLRAGDGAGGTDTATVDADSSNVEYRDSGGGSTSPTTFTFRQDAAIADGDISDNTNFGNNVVTGITSYTITSDAGSLGLSTASRVAGAGMILSGTSINIGTNIVPASLSTASGVAVTLGGNVTTSGGAVSFGGAVTLSGNRTIDTTNAGGTAAGANVSFASTVDGAQTLSVAGGTGGVVSFTGAVGGTTPLTGLTVSSSGSIAAGALTVAGGVSLTSGGTVGLTGGVTTTGGGTLTVSNGGTLTISGAALSLDGAFNQSGGGGVTLSQNISTTNDAIFFTNAITLGGAVVLSSGTATTTVANVSAGANNLTITADEIDLTGAANGITGTGNLTLQNSTAALAMSFTATPAGGQLDFTPTELATIDSGFTLVTLGSSTAGTVTVTDAIALNSPTAIVTGGDFSNAAGISGTTLTISSGGDMSVQTGITATTSLLLWSGTDGTGDMTFNAVPIDSPTITLRAGSGSGSTAEVSADLNGPTFQNGAGTNPTNFTIRQDGSIDDTNLPQGVNFGATDASGINYTIQSDGGNIDLTDASKVDGSNLSLITAGSNRARIGVAIAPSALTVTGRTRLDANVTTPAGAVVFGGPVTLGNSVTVDTTNGGANAGGANISFNSTVDALTAATQGLTVRAGTSGDVTHSSNVGGTTQLAGYTITSVHDFTAPVFTVTSLTQTTGSGTTLFSGRVTANAAGGITLNGAAFTFQGGVDTASGGAFNVTNTGLFTISSGASARFQLDGLFGKLGAGNSSVSANISTTNDNITFGGAGGLTLGAAVTFNAGTGTIALNSTNINGQNFTLTGNGIDFLGSVTGTGAGTLLMQGATSATTIGVGGGSGTLQIDDTDLAALADGAAGSIVIGASNQAGLITVDSSTFHDATTIRSTSGGTVALVGALVGDQSDAALTLSGATVNLASTITTSGAAVAVNGAATVSADSAIDTTNAGGSAAGANITFANDINSSSPGANTLTLTSGTAGDLSVQNVGQTNALAGFIVTGSHDISAQAIGADTTTLNAGNNAGTAAVTAGTFTSTVGGTGTYGGLVTSFAGGITVAGAGAHTFSAGATTLTGGTFSATNSGLLTLTGTFSLDGAFSRTGSGNTSLGGNITTSNDNVTFGGTGTTTLSGTRTVSAGTGTIAFNALNVNGQNLTLTGDGIDFLGGANTVTGNGSGTLTMQGSTAATTIGVGGGAGTLQIDGTDLGALADEAVGAIVIGNSAQSGTVTADASTFHDAVTLRAANGTVDVVGALVGDQTDASVTLTGSLVALEADVTTSGAAIAVNGAATVTTNVAIDTTNAGGSPAGANITFANAVDSATPGIFTLSLLSGTAGDLSMQGVGQSSAFAVFNVVNAHDVTTQAITANTLTFTSAHDVSTQALSTDAFSSTLTGTGTYSGLVSTFAGGIFVAGSGSHTFAAGATTLVGGAFTATNTGSLSLTGTFALDGAFTRTGGATTLGSTISTTNDDVTFTGVADTLTLLNSATITVGTGTISFGGGVAMGGNNLILRGDGIDFLGGNNSVTGTGAGTIQLGGGSDATTIGLAGGAGTLQLTQTDLNAITAGAVSEILIGSATGTGNITVPVGGVTFTNSVRFLGDTAHLVLNGPVTAPGGGGCLTFDLAVDLGTDLTASCIVFNDALAITASGVDLTATSAQIDFNSTVNLGGFGLTARADDINFAGGADSVTGTGAGLLTLTRFSAGDIRVATTGSGLVISGTDLAALADNFGSLQIGVLSDANTITLGAASYRDPVSFQTAAGGSIVVGAAQTGTGNAAFNFNGPTSLGAGITTVGGGIVFDGATTLTGASSLAAGAGTVEFSSTLALGGNDLTISADGIDFSGGAGTITGNGSGTLSLEGSGAATTIGVGGGAGTLQIDDTDLAALADEAAGSILIGASGQTGAVTADSSTFHDAVTLRSGGGLVSVGGVLVGDQSDASITLTGTSVLLGANVTTSGAAVAVNGATTVAANAIVDTTNAGGTPAGADITFAGDVNALTPGSNTLDLTAGTGGDITLANVGQTNALAAFNINSAHDVSSNAISAGTFSSTLGGTGTYSGLLSTSNAGGITLSGTGAHSVLAGATTTGGGGFTSNHTGLLTLSGTFSLQGAFDRTSGASSVGATVQTAGQTINFGGAVTLTANTIIDATFSGGSPAGAAISFLGLIDADAAANNRTLTVNAGTGGSAVFGQNVGASQSLGSLAVAANTVAPSISMFDVTTSGGQDFAGWAALNGNLSNTGAGDIVFHHNVTINQDVTIVASGNAGDDISIGGTLDSNNILAHAATIGGVGNLGNVTITGAVGAAFPLTTLTIHGAAIGTGAVTTTGAQAYTGDLTAAGNLAGASITVTGDTVLTGNATTTGAQLYGGTLNAMGNLTASSVNVTGDASIAGNVGTTGAQDYDADLTLAGTLTGQSVAVDGNLLLAGDVSIDVSGGTFATVSGTTDSTASQFFSLTITGPTITLGGAVGQATNGALGSLTTLGGGTLNLGGGAVTTRDAQTYTSNTTLLADTVYTSTSAGDVRFNGTINSDGTGRALTVNTAGGTLFTGTLGNLAALASITTDAPGYTGINTNTTSTGATTINDNAVIGGTVLMNASAVTFDQQVNSNSVGTPQNLTVNAPTGAINFNGIVGAAARLQTLTATGASVNLASISTVGAQTYTTAQATLHGSLDASSAADIVFTGALDLTGDSTITTAGGGVNISGAVNSLNSEFSLGVTAGAGDVVLGGDVGTGSGSRVRLSSFTVSGDSLTLKNIRTSGSQSLTGTLIGLNGNLDSQVGGSIVVSGPLSLLADTQVTANNGAVQFGGTVDSNGTARSLIVTAGGGNEVLFAGAVGNASGGALSALTVAASGGSARFSIASAAERVVKTTGDQTYNASVVLGTDMTFNGNDINFGGTINSELAGSGNARALTVTTNTVSGDTGETVFSGVVGGVNALQSLSTNSEGITRIGANITTLGGMTFADPVRLTQDATLDAGTGTMFFRGAIDTDSAAGAERALTLLTSMNSDLDNTPIKFGGNIGSTRRLSSLTIGADRTTAQRGTTALYSDGFDANGIVQSGTFQALDSFTINVGTGGFSMGRGQKLTAFGSLNILSQGVVTLGDLTSLTSITVKGTAIRLKLRDPGSVFDNQLETGTDLLRGDAGLDIVAANTITFADTGNNPIAPVEIPFGSASHVIFATNSGEKPLNLAAFNFLTITYSAEPGWLGPDKLDVNFFIDPRTGNGGRLLGLDIAAKGPVSENVATSIAGAIPRDTESRENAPPVTISAALREPLQEMGISVRDLQFPELVEYLVGRALYRDLPGKPSPKAEDIKVTVNRLSAEPVQAVIAAYRGLLYKETTGPDGQTQQVPNQEEIRTILETAWSTYAEQAGDRASGVGFASWLKTRGASASAEEREAARILDGLRDLLTKIEALGLSPREAKIPRDRILGEIKPQSMTDEQMLDAVRGEEAKPVSMGREWMRTALRAEPALPLAMK